MLPHAIFDTNIILRYRAVQAEPSHVSAVVIQELTAGAKDGDVVQRYGLYRQRYEAAGRLLVPTGEDWWHAGKILNSLYRGLKSRSKGHTPAFRRRSSSASSATC